MLNKKDVSLIDFFSVESSKGSLAEGESKNKDAISPVISTNDRKSSRDGKPDQSESANGVEAQLGGSGAGCIKKTDPYKGTGAIPKRRKQGNSRKPETQSSSKDTWAEETRLACECLTEMAEKVKRSRQLWLGLAPINEVLPRSRRDKRDKRHLPDI